MKIVLLTTKAEDEMLSVLKSTFSQAEVVTVNAEESTDFSMLKGCDVLVNMVGAKKPDIQLIKELDSNLGIESNLAELSLNTVATFGIIGILTKIAAALKEYKPKLVLNAGYPIDLVTLYLYKAHGITSYGLSAKANNLLQDFLTATKLGKVKDAKYKAVGRLGSNWIVEVTDSKGQDLYAQARANVADISLDVKRHTLTKDSLRSLKFYGYYHSADTPEESIETACVGVISAIFGEKNSTVYFATINKGELKDFDSEALVELPFDASLGKLAVQKVSLPLPCALALNDYISTLSVAAVALEKKSQTIFKRAIKLDPYLASILSLAELETYSRGLISIYNLEKAFLQEAL